MDDVDLADAGDLVKTDQAIDLDLGLGLFPGFTLGAFGGGFSFVSPWKKSKSPKEFSSGGAFPFVFPQ